MLNGVMSLPTVSPVTKNLLPGFVITGEVFSLTVNKRPPETAILVPSSALTPIM